MKYVLSGFLVSTLALAACVAAGTATADDMPPPAANPMAMGPSIDKSKIPAPVTAAASGSWGYKPLNFGEKHVKPSPRNPDGTVSQAYEVRKSTDGIGAFRITCAYSHMSFDDPIVYPGKPGLSHLHTFVGKHTVGQDAFATPENIRNPGAGSTCAGGEANNTMYWFPAMVDAATATPVAPSDVLIYYKSSYTGVPNDDIKALPKGLRMITGNAKNATGDADHTRYVCLGPKGENPGWQHTMWAALDAAAKPNMGHCGKGSDFMMEVLFPICWDGVNLDSPNHNSHMSDPESYRVGTVPGTSTAAYKSRCPASHPVHIPTITYEIHYRVPADGAVDKWRLSSDAYDASQPAGRSGHGDYLMGWNPDVMAAFVKNCLLAAKDCKANLLGDDTYLSQP